MLLERWEDAKMELGSASPSHPPFPPDLLLLYSDSGSSSGEDRVAAAVTSVGPMAGGLLLYLYFTDKNQCLNGPLTCAGSKKKEVTSLHKAANLQPLLLHCAPLPIQDTIAPHYTSGMVIGRQQTTKQMHPSANKLFF